MRMFLYRIGILIVFIFLMPLVIFIGVSVLCFSGFPVLFKQQRTGKGGKPFTLYKFRTMVPDAEKRKSRLRAQNEASGVVFKIHDDSRFTRIGKFLSHTGLDELPQLINVLKGDMALIGPRPLPVAEAKKLKPWMRKRHAILPGIISPAILTGKYHQDFEGWMRSDAAYAKRKSWQEDVRVFLRSVPFVARLFVRSVHLLA